MADESVAAVLNVAKIDYTLNGGPKMCHEWNKTWSASGTRLLTATSGPAGQGMATRRLSWQTTMTWTYGKG
jgi:hypothetical protein